MTTHGIRFLLVFFILKCSVVNSLICFAIKVSEMVSSELFVSSSIEENLP